MTALVPWRPRFFDEHGIFEAIREAASSFAGARSFPSPEAIDEALGLRSGVRFVRKRQTDKKLYDTRIVEERVVPTRLDSWHDLLNACVWATFPRAKLALHRRQYELVVPHAPHRTPEQDALAMLDEGGIFLRGEARPLVFGHAIFESIVAGWPTPRAAGIELGVTPVSAVDPSAASVVADPTRLRSTTELLRVDLAAAS